jgi:cell division septation protein DedD
MTRATAARRGAHRSRRDIAGAFVPSLLAVLAVSAMITALYVWRGESPDTATPASATTKQSTTAPAPSTSAPSKATTKAPGKPATTAATSHPPSTETTSKAGVPVGDLEIVVLNATGRKGLARIVANRLRDKGWTVALVSNFRGSVPATTVYYPPGAQADAEAAAAGLPTEPRVRPRFGNLSTSRLTVVVTDSYPS